MSRSAYPLSWPEGWKRAKPGFRQRARFNKIPFMGYDQQGQAQYQSAKRLSVADAVKRVLGELSRMAVRSDDVLISTNVPLRLDGYPRSDQEQADPGAAVYWQVRGKAMRHGNRCMAIDQYDRVADNLAAIAATLEAMRAIERHGGATILDRAFLGFAALPERASASWRDVLGLNHEIPINLELVEERFRILAHKHHPDKGGDPEKFQEIVKAREAAHQELQ